MKRLVSRETIACLIGLAVFWFIFKMSGDVTSAALNTTLISGIFLVIFALLFNVVNTTYIVVMFASFTAAFGWMAFNTISLSISFFALILTFILIFVAALVLSNMANSVAQKLKARKTRIVASYLIETVCIWGGFYIITVL